MPFGKGEHAHVVQLIAKGLQRAGKLDSYLELGVCKGTTFNMVAPLARRACAVDIDELVGERIKGNANASFFNVTTDRFFDIHKEKHDLIFIDADHHSARCKQDLINALTVINDGGLILMHDTYPPNEDCRDNHCHDTWTVAVWAKEQGLECVTLPFYYGITIIRVASKHLVWEK